MAVRRTTVEIDEELLARAKKALDLETTRATVEEALRRVADQAETEFAERAERQMRALKRIDELTDMDVFASNEMWR